MSQVRTQVTWNGPEVEARMHDAAAFGLHVAAEFLLTEANHSVPFLVGILEQSGVATVDDRHLTAAVTYDTPYAVRQHEDLTLRHPNGRRAKWLELAATENAGKIQGIIAAQVRRRMGS